MERKDGERKKTRHETRERGGGHGHRKKRVCVLENAREEKIIERVREERR